MRQSRQEKYPDTEVFHFYNANPRNRYTSDCVVRAICTATEIPYSTVVMEMAELQCKTGYDDGDGPLINMYLESRGWHRHKQPRKPNGWKYRGGDFCLSTDYGKKYDRIVANIGGHHIVAIIDGKVNDTWDSTDGCIGNYWTREE